MQMTISFDWTEREREREREREEDKMCMCVCLREKEKSRKKQHTKKSKNILTNIWKKLLSLTERLHKYFFDVVPSGEETSFNHLLMSVFQLSY